MKKLKALRRLVDFSLLSIICFAFFSCLTAGTHGSIDSFDFPVSKSILQKSVNAVLAKGGDLNLAPITDTFTSKYYNDGERYVTMLIQVEGGVNEYTFQYTGEKEYWDTAKTSEISIAYAFDKNNEGGSTGNGKYSSSDAEVKKNLIAVFKNKFIQKIDSVLANDK